MSPVYKSILNAFVEIGTLNNNPNLVGEALRLLNEPKSESKSCGKSNNTSTIIAREEADWLEDMTAEEICNLEPLTYLLEGDKKK